MPVKSKNLNINIQAVTSVSYGLIVALIICIGLGVLSLTGIKLAAVFSASDNAIKGSIPYQRPLNDVNPGLLPFQQKEVSDAESEITQHTAFASCLLYMNNHADEMAANGTTCLNNMPEFAPPQLPMYSVDANQETLFIEPNNVIYKIWSISTVGNNSAVVEYYADGYTAFGQSMNLLNGYNGANPIITSTGQQQTSIGIGYFYNVTGVIADPNASAHPNASASAPLGMYVPQ